MHKISVFQGTFHLPLFLPFISSQFLIFLFHVQWVSYPTFPKLTNRSLFHVTRTTDLVHSAKVVADAVQAHIRHEPEKYDKVEAAGATADLINAAAEFGKLGDDKGIGKYVDEAEDCLRRCQTSHSAYYSSKTGGHKVTKSEGHGVMACGGGAGDFMKMAGDFLKK